MSLEGVADLPLHDGHVPSWLIGLMRRLSRAVAEVIVMEYGPEELVRRLASPLWFQAFNNLIGMDWDSSGSTTVTMAVLREALGGGDLGVMVLGGKGRRARRVPLEVPVAVERLGLPDSYVRVLERASRLAAKVDSALLQDGYQIYHHSLVVSEDGTWCVVQQGMNVERRLARRYHWLSSRVTCFVEEPHAAIACSRRGVALNLVARESRGARSTILDLLQERPARLTRMIGEALRMIRGEQGLDRWLGVSPTGIAIVDARARLEYYRPLKLTRSMLRVLRTAYELKPRSLEEAILVRGLGPETVRALALVADVIYGEPPSTRDPVTHPLDPFKYAYAFGGKDGVPYPVKRELMEEVVSLLEEAVARARIGDHERLKALARLRRLAARLNP